MKTTMQSWTQFTLLASLLLSLPLPSTCQSPVSATLPPSAIPTSSNLTNQGSPDRSDNRPCYFPDGSQAAYYDGYRACPSLPGEHAMCCKTYPQGENVPSEYCLNGLCYAPSSNKAFSESIFREACTDPTFSAPECLRVCTGLIAGVPGMNHGVNVRQCDNSNMFCCGMAGQKDTDECCNSWKGFGISFTSGIPIVKNFTGPPETPTPSAARSSDGTPVSSSDAALSPTSKSTMKSNPGIIAGIAAVVVLLIALLAVGILWHRQRKRWKKRSKEEVYSQFHNRSSVLVASDSVLGMKAELDASARRIDELDGTPRAEMFAPRPMSEMESAMPSPISRPGTAGVSRMSTMMTERSDRPISELMGVQLIAAGEVFELDSAEVSKDSLKSGRSSPLSKHVQSASSGSRSSNSSSSSSSGSLRPTGDPLSLLHPALLPHPTMPSQPSSPTTTARLPVRALSLRVPDLSLGDISPPEVPKRAKSESQKRP